MAPRKISSQSQGSLDQKSRLKKNGHSMAATNGVAASSGRTRTTGASAVSSTSRATATATAAAAAAAASAVSRSLSVLGTSHEQQEQHQDQDQDGGAAAWTTGGGVAPFFNLNPLFLINDCPWDHPLAPPFPPSPGAPPLTDEGACPAMNQQAMNSSSHDLDAAGDSPAPPAISPLTDPADPGNREPFPPGDLDLAALDDHAEPPPHPLPNATHPSRPSSTDALLSGSQPLSHLAHGHSHSHDHNLVPDAPMADLQQQLPVAGSGYFPDPLDAFTSPLRDNTFGGWNGRPNGTVYDPALYMAALHNLANPGTRPMTTVHPSLISSSSHGTMVGAALPGEDPGRSLESFARIEFADSVFQMTTYAVIIGRDQNALSAAKRDKRRADEHELRVKEARANGLPDPPPPAFGTRNKFSRSYVSNEGGMLGPESDGEGDSRLGKRRKRPHSGSGEQPAALDDQDRRAGKRRKRALSDSGGLPQLSDEPEADDTAPQDDPNVISERQYVSHTPGARAVNVAALIPSPCEVPFIGIHSPHPNVIAGTKGISRQHLKIQFSSERGVFEAIPLHKNGFFVGDTFYKDEKVVLRSGDMIQIKDVTFNIIINGVPRGKTGAEEYVEESEPETTQGRTSTSEGPKAMSLAFESTHPVGRESTSVEAEDAPVEGQPEPEPATPLPKPGVPKAQTPSEASSPEGDPMDVDQDASGVLETIEDDGDEHAEGDEHGEGDERAEGEENTTPAKHDVNLASLLGIGDMPFKKRGPGRPPKNGIMSKREERVRKKAALELAKQNMPPPPPGEPPIKRKVGRPRKHPLPDDAGGDRPEKRRYKPRKKNGEEGGESDGERIQKEKRREKPKTPPLELDRNNYTEEQLQKPNKNYGVLIDEVLTAALPDGLTLKQIYKRIQMKYPFYYFTVDTKGWESSVRHNLIGNVAFKKNEETHLWCRVPGIDIDAGKKRKAPSPDNAGNLQNFNPQYATPASYGAVPNYHQTTGAPSAGYPGGPTAGVAGQPLQQLPGAAPSGVPLQPPRQPYPNQGQAPAATQAPAYQQAAATRPPLGVSPGTSYSAPYAQATAPMAMAAQPGATPHSMARQYAQPSNGSAVPNGIPPVHRTHTTPVAAAAQHVARPAQQPAAPIHAPLKPAVSTELVKFVIKFKITARESLAKISPTADAIIAAAIHRVMGLTTRALEPTEEALAKIVVGVFETSRKNLIERDGVRAELMVLHPELLQALLEFKDKIFLSIQNSVGIIRAEQLILSAVDRALGFADRSNMTGTPADVNQVNKAEEVLIPAISSMIADHQKRVANAAALKMTTPSAGSLATTYQPPANSAGTSTPTYRPTAAGPAAVAAQRPLPPTNAAPSSSATPAAMYWSAAAPAGVARLSVPYPPRPPAQAVNAHVAHAPTATPAAYRAPQPTPPTNAAASQPRSAPATLAAAKCASAPPTPALSTSAPSAVPRTSAPPSVPAAPSVYTPQSSLTPPVAKAALPNPAAPPSVPAAPSVYTPQTSFTPPVAKAALPNPAAQSSRPMPPTAAAPANAARAPTTMAPAAPVSAAPMSAAPVSAATLPTAAAPPPTVIAAVAPPAPMMAPVPSPAVTAPTPAPAPATMPHTLAPTASPPLPRAAAPPVTTPSLPTATTAP